MSHSAPPIQPPLKLPRPSAPSCMPLPSTGPALPHWFECTFYNSQALECLFIGITCHIKHANMLNLSDVSNEFLLFVGPPFNYCSNFGVLSITSARRSDKTDHKVIIYSFPEIKSEILLNDSMLTHQSRSHPVSMSLSIYFSNYLYYTEC